jgi:hypothetical protein
MACTAEASIESSQKRRLRDLAPAFFAAIYPDMLRAFHLFTTLSRGNEVANEVVAGLALLAAIFMPFAALIFVLRPPTNSIPSDYDVAKRRLAYLAVAAPTLYVFIGVVLGMTVPDLQDEIVWDTFWLGAAAWCWMASPSKAHASRPPNSGRLRIAHGIVATILIVFVSFHLSNHLVGLAGPDLHKTLMKAGRRVYRSPFIEPLLVSCFVFQALSGLSLAWRWSSVPGTDFYRAFQIASGFYLSIFILGHMNSVFVYARLYLKIDSDWAFATGAPTGLIYDSWNIRLLPHYTLGVFFVLTHIASGLRVVLLSHGTRPLVANRLWMGTAGVSAMISATIIFGMCGLRVSLPVATLVR